MAVDLAPRSRPLVTLVLWTLLTLAGTPGAVANTNQSSSSGTTPSPRWLWGLLVAAPVGWVGLALWRRQQEHQAAEAARTHPDAPPSGAAIAAQRIGTVVAADRAGRLGKAAIAPRGPALEVPQDRFARGDRSQLNLTPPQGDWIHATWTLTPQDQAAVQHHGSLALRLYDATDCDRDRQNPHSVQQFDCTGQQDYWIALPMGDRDYGAELGYLRDGQWIVVVRSAVLRSMRQSLTMSPSADEASPSLHEQLFQLAMVGQAAWLSGGGLGHAPLRLGDRALINPEVDPPPSWQDEPHGTEDAGEDWFEQKA
jgi:hypothetical protein